MSATTLTGPVSRRPTREPIRIDRPLVAFARLDIRPDGSIHTPSGSGWSAPVQRAEPCPVHRADVAYLVSGLRRIVPREHRAPMPWCTCGLSVSYHYPSTPDRFHDRLGSVLRTVGLVEVWGRIILEASSVRAEFGRILAIAVDPDDIPARRHRAQLAAHRFGATVICDPTGDGAALLAATPAGESRARLSHGAFADALRRKSCRRWLARDHKQAWARGSRAASAFLTVAAVAVGLALHGLGIPVGASMGITVWLTIVAAAALYLHARDSSYSFEVIAPPRLGDDPTGQPIEVGDPVITRTR